MSRNGSSSSSGKRFREFNHTGDVGVIVRGKTVEEIFINSLSALASMYFDPEELRTDREIQYRGRFESIEDGLVDLLNFAIMEIDSENVLYHTVSKIRISESEVEASLVGFTILEEQVPKRVLKAVTYHEIKVDLEKGYATILFDI